MEFSTESEILIVTGISNFSLLVYNTLPYNNLILDFLFWICPQYFIIMYPDQKWNLIIFLFLVLDFNKIRPTSNSISNKELNTAIIRILRSFISCQVAICILGVDFTGMFPLRFGKTIDYGYKLMDVGIGSYLYNNGLMINKDFYLKRSCPLKKRQLLNIVNNNRSIILLFLLGFIRYITILIFNLDVEITEYGKHSNFYFLLSILQVLYKLFPYNKLGYLLILIFHFVTRYYQIDKFILNNNRTGFIYQNKESFFAIIPYLCLLMILQDVSRILFYPFTEELKIETNFEQTVSPCKFINCTDCKKQDSTIKTNSPSFVNRQTSTQNIKYKIIHLSKLSLIFFVIYKLFLFYELPSRRLGNCTYIFQIAYLHTFHLLIYIVVSYFSSFKQYLSLNFVSRNMMSNFLLTNTLVLILKQLIEFKNELCHLIMIIYLVVSFILPPAICLLCKRLKINTTIFCK